MPLPTELDFPTAEVIKARVAATLRSDPKVAIEASPATVLTGGNVTYTITLTNGRPVQADNVVVIDNLPPGLSFVSCTATGGGVCGGTGNNRTVAYAALPGNSTDTITLVAAVECALADGTPIANGVSLSSGTPDFNPTNNSAAASITTSNPPPVIGNLTVNSSVLSPPNHGMRDIPVSYIVTDNCAAPALLATVSSNEPIDAIGNGDGNTTPDWIVLDANNLQLRAERAGHGDGRIYTITITATDSGGRSSSQQVQVTVPKGQP